MAETAHEKRIIAAGEFKKNKANGITDQSTVFLEKFGSKLYPIISLDENTYQAVSKVELTNPVNLL